MHGLPLFALREYYSFFELLALLFQDTVICSQFYFFLFFAAYLFEESLIMLGESVIGSPQILVFRAGPELFSFFVDELVFFLKLFLELLLVTDILLCLYEFIIEQFVILFELIDCCLLQRSVHFDIFELL